MRSFAVSIVAGAACVSIAAVAVAQERQHERGGPGGPQAAPGAQGGPPIGAGKERGRAQERPNEGGPGREMPRATAPEHPETPRNVERPDDRGRRAVEQERDRRVTKGRGGPDQAAQSEREERARSEREKATPVERGRKDAERQPDRREAQGVERHERVRHARTRLSGDQLVRFRGGFDRQHARIRNAEFTVRIGTRIPRSVRLFPISRELVSFVPDYSYYRYVVIDDVVCIIDPDTYEIVDVIDEGRPDGRPQIAELHLVPAERALVLDSIAPDFPQADVRLKLALGAEIPRFVEFHSFPDVVLDRVSKLRDFQFIVAQDDLVIVDPRSREIALVIERR